MSEGNDLNTLDDWLNDPHEIECIKSYIEGSEQKARSAVERGETPFLADLSVVYLDRLVSKYKWMFDYIISFYAAGKGGIGGWTEQQIAEDAVRSAEREWSREHDL